MFFLRHILFSQKIGSVSDCQEKWQRFSPMWDLRPVAPRLNHHPVCGLLRVSFQAFFRTLRSCTDGLCSFIHKGYTNFDLALHLQPV